MTELDCQVVSISREKHHRLYSQHVSTLGNVVNIFDICYQCKSLAQKHEENYITDKTSNLYYGVNPWVATANACQGELVVAIKYQFDITDVRYHKDWLLKLNWAVINIWR